MKTAVLALFFGASIFSYAEEKVYLSMDKLSFTEGGIFLRNGHCVLQLPAIGHDERGYHLISDEKNGTTIIKCACCGYYTWWVEKHCCLYEDCVYYCY